MKCKIYHSVSFYGLLLTAGMLLAGCSKDSGDSAQQAKQEPQEIRVQTNVTSVQNGTRATTIDSNTELQGQNLKIDAYYHDTETAYLLGKTLHYDSNWKFWNTSTSSQEHYYWPLPATNGGAWPSLDFFGYMPASPPSYITAGPTYSAPGTPGVPQASFTCTLPMTYDASDTEGGQGSNLQEFIWGITVGQNKTNQGVSGVTMKLRHPFARIKFQLAANHPDIQINSITFKSLKTGGTCTLNNTEIESTYYKTSAWSALTLAEGGSNLVMTLARKVDDGKGNMVWKSDVVNTFNNDPSNTTPIGGWTGSAHEFVNLLVVPQAFAGAIEVNASWNDWGDTPVEHTVTTTIPAITWQPGYSYTYTFFITPEDLVVNLTDFTEQW